MHRCSYLWKRCAGRPSGLCGTVRHLQSVFNAAAWLIYHIWDLQTTITNALVSLHWLRVPERVLGRYADVQKSCSGRRHGIWDSLLGSRISPIDGHCTRPALVACWYHPSDCQQSAAGSSQLLVPVSGTPYRKSRHQHHHWRFSANIWPGISLTV